MSMTRAEILNAAMDLPEQDRLILADELMDSISERLLGWSDGDLEGSAQNINVPQGTTWSELLSQNEQTKAA